jgi:hypothetical protein
MKCKQCDKETKLKTHKFCSKECYWKSLEGIKGENAPNYRETVTQNTVHHWLNVNYGKPKTCEGVDCRGTATWYDWALITGKQYERKRENFMRLCRSCHRRYDLTPEKKLQAIKNLIKHNPYANKKSYDKYKKLV